MSPLPPLLLRGDCLTELARIPDASIDAVVTDPPYGLEFMGKAWDKYTPLDFELWCAKWAAECLRILKPGGHLLAFGGSRTWHRLAAGIEDAGFEIRDSIAWLYGSGFPKSMDVSKAIDKLDAADERMRRAFAFTAWMRSTGITAKKIDKITGTAMGNHYTTHPTQPHIATAELFDMLRPYLGDVPPEIEALVAEREVESQNYAARKVTGAHTDTAPGQNMQRLDGKAPKMVDPLRRDEAHTAAAREWEGWGTALKPAFEPVVVARKPLGERTVAANVLAHGTGALNIDACRITASTSLGDARSSHAGNSEGTGLLREDARTSRSENTQHQASSAPALAARNDAPSNEEADAQMRTLAEDSRSDYPSSRRSGDAPLRRAEVGDRDVAPSRGDVHEPRAPHASERRNRATTRPYDDSTTLNVERGRWPANVALDESQAAALDEQAPKTGAAAKASGPTLRGRHDTAVAYGARNGLEGEPAFHGDAGGASRFFYVAKAPKSERPVVDGTAHPTVKPLALMRWLCRLVTPPGGIVVDPFAGSGTTLEAAYLEGFESIGVEMTPEYWPLIAARIERVTR